MRPGETTAQRNLRLFETEAPVAVVTGSTAPRVGRVIAEHLQAEGFQVVLHGHRDGGDAERVQGAESESSSRTGSVCVLTGAVEDEANVVRWTELVRERMQRVDLLVNSAAVWAPKSLEMTTARDFEQFLQVNAVGTALACKHFGLLMAQQSSGGAIVNIGDWAITRPYRDFAAYFPSKGAVPAITQSMAVELALRNARVRVNAVLPGPVMLDDSISAQRRQLILNECLLRREGTPADVADAVMYLATSPFVTGVCLPVDGGRTIYAGPSADPVAHPDVE